MSDSEPKDTKAPDEFPNAIISDWNSLMKQLYNPEFLRSTKMWWLTAGCVVLALALTISSMRSHGKTITVRFEDGHGIKPHDTLRFRGIDIGEVTRIEMDQDLSSVNVMITLTPKSTGIAREGTRFWIERPQIGLTRMSGLDTVVGAKYIGVMPGPQDGKPKTRFEGIESPPVLRESSQQEITIRFRDGRGLAAGNVVKHRGIVVGEVTGVELDDQLQGVKVVVRLAETASQLARVGSQFWVERPRLSVAEVRGLDTLVTGQYIAVIPGPSDAEPHGEFEGLEVAPSAPRTADGLEIILESPQRWGLESGAPVAYRGLTVGHVISVSLASDAAGLEARVFIQPDFKPLIRDNTRFWSTSGFDVEFDITGIQLNADTLSTIAAGGVAFATPDQLGEQVSTGHRFPYQKDPDNDWLDWKPRILIGAATLPDGQSLPEPLRATLRWKEKRFAIQRKVNRQGWVLPLEDGRILALAELFRQPDRAVGDVTIELAGQRFTLDPKRTDVGGRLAYYELEGDLSKSTKPWPKKRIRRPERPESCQLIGDPQAPKLPISAGRLEDEHDRWPIDPSLPLSEQWSGASVVSIDDGSLIGVVQFEKGQASVVKIDATMN